MWNQAAAIIAAINKNSLQSFEWPSSRCTLKPLGSGHKRISLYISNLVANKSCTSHGTFELCKIHEVLREELNTGPGFVERLRIYCGCHSAVPFMVVLKYFDIYRVLKYLYKADIYCWDNFSLTRCCFMLYINCIIIFDTAFKYFMFKDVCFVLTFIHCYYFWKSRNLMRITLSVYCNFELT